MDAAAPRPVAVLTGGTSGLGRFVALGLVRAGFLLVLMARDTAKARSVRDWLLNAEPTAVIEVELVDLGLLGEARSGAARIAARHPAIGVLVLNAGTFQTRRKTTAEGHELVLAVNHLVPFVLIGALAAAVAAGSGRVVAVGSSTSDRARIDPDNLELARGWGMVRAYGQSKLALMATSFAWGRRLAPLVRVNVVHPGTVATDLVRARGMIGLAWQAMRPFVLTAEQGAATPLRAALDPALAETSLRYLKPGGFAAPNTRAIDPDLVARVWRATAALAGEIQPGADQQSAEAKSGRA